MPFLLTALVSALNWYRWTETTRIDLCGQAATNEVMYSFKASVSETRSRSMSLSGISSSTYGHLTLAGIAIKVIDMKRGLRFKVLHDWGAEGESYIPRSVDLGRSLGPFHSNLTVIYHKIWFAFSTNSNQKKDQNRDYTITLFVRGIFYSDVNLRPCRVPEGPDDPSVRYLDSANMNSTVRQDF